MLIAGTGDEGTGAAPEIDPVEIARTTFGPRAGEGDVVAFGVELRPAVDLGPGGQLVLAGAVGPHRPDVASADEGDLAPIGGEIRFAVGWVFGQLVEVPFFGRVEAAFGLFDFAAFRFFDGGDRPREDDGTRVTSGGGARCRQQG